MSKIFRFSGYFVDSDKDAYNIDRFENALCEQAEYFSVRSRFQQLHIEESEEFDAEEELEPDCDLALLTRHFKKDIPMEYDRPLPQPGEVYKHFKIGKCVKVIGISRHTETEEVCVVYDYEGTIWVRPLDMFMSEVDTEKYPNATQKYRFERVE